MNISTHFRTVRAYAGASEDSIQAWLIEQITRATGLLANQIDITQPFAYYGIDSVAAAGLSGELANWLGENIAPTITWDYPTVKLLARHLACRPASYRPAMA